MKCIRTITLKKSEVEWLYAHLESLYDVPEAVAITKQMTKTAVIKPKFTKREKFIFTAACPSVSNFKEDGVITTIKEIKELNEKCRGTYFDMYDILEVEEYFACSPCGKKKYFEYGFEEPCSKQKHDLWKNTAKRAAILWSKGNSQKALALDDYNWNVNYK